MRVYHCGFALKFYTEDGKGDLFRNNTPVFFVKNPKKFGDFIHTQKRDPQTNMKSPTMMWGFWSLNPESLHQVLILISPHGWFWKPYIFIVNDNCITIKMNGFM
ncbi:catalase [Pedobacter mendelii]|uniref:catalase n=1 Tax=Pedobacter mendelii TaxID=1908240 RepID=A0ABQ2BGP0_9SPHI|nr:catalase [Pedobacter mendelii]GGI24072.1 hypothetical protein GCM10008119_10830 [Pedobacter mendelii]